MPTTTQEVIHICLFDVPEKEQAVIQRVITFGASQGKPYSLHSDYQSAQIVITTDNTTLPISSAIRIRIGDSSLPSDLVLQRPLLVTRVMRALDDAAHLLKSRPAIPNTINVVQEPEAATVAKPTTIEPAAPEPIVSKVESTTSTAPVETIPVTQVTVTPEKVTPSETTEPTTEYRYTALVVDDSAAIRKQLELELRNAHIKAEFAETGEEALEKSAQKAYDLIFLDIIMPGIDGYEVCRQMRSRKAMKKTPIIMLSGKTSPLDEVQGVIAGASTYLTKPVKHEQFQQTLTRVSKWLSNFAR
ncbi:MAG: hypothetical protein RI964_163 [Pseudomonadota bacterium]|jgi:CheY-like chemotaxis protein